METHTNPNSNFASTSSDPNEDEINLYLKIISTVALKVKRFETINNLKALICEKEGIAENLQELFFVGNRLKDDHRLVDYGIQQDSTLHLVLQNLVGMKLYVKIPSDQKTIVIEARTFDTIQNIKSIIQAKEGIQSNQYALIYYGKLLEDDRMLASFNIPNESTLNLVFNPKDVLPIFVKTVTGEILKLEVKVLFTVRDVKAIVGSMTGVLVSDWDLIYSGKKLEDCKTLARYDIKEEDILQMLPALIQVFVKMWSGKTITVDVQRCNSVKDVKDKIFHKLKISANYQSIVFSGKRLEEDRDLASYGIQMHSTLHMVFSPSAATFINIRLVDIGRSIQPSTTIRILKDMIEKKMRAPVKEIYFNGAALLDDRSLADYFTIIMYATVKVIFCPDLPYNGLHT